MEYHLLTSLSQQNVWRISGRGSSLPPMEMWPLEVGCRAQSDEELL